MRIALLLCLTALIGVSPVPGQEEVGVQQQPQTLAPNVTLQRPQAATCGAAPTVSQINRLTPVVTAMFRQPRMIDDALKAEIRKSCQRNRAAIYLVRAIAANNWTLLPAPGIVAGFPPGSVACGLAPTGTDLNAVIAKIRPLFADPRPFDANIAGIGRQPCAPTRAMLYLFSLMVDNDLAFRR